MTKPVRLQLSRRKGFNLQLLSLATNGLFVLESAKRDAVVLPADWQLHREAIYGDTRVSYVACG